MNRGQMVDKALRCPDCGVLPGRAHLAGCDVERCSVCSLQFIGCEHDEPPHQPELAFWTGYWPGDESVRLLGLQDQNDLVRLIANVRGLG